MDQQLSQEDTGLALFGVDAYVENEENGRAELGCRNN